jgi:hypothetical protein
MNTASRLASFAAVVAIAFGGAAAVGSGIGPVDVADTAATHSEMNTTDESSDVDTSGDPPRGLAVADAGYRLVVHTADVAKGDTSEFEFSIVDDSGTAVTEFDELHERRLHFIVMSRNLVDYDHLHPDMDGSGRWTVELPAMAPGSYRVFADFQPEGGDNHTLGTDLLVNGDVQAVAVPEPVSAFDIDGYTVTMAGTPSVGDTDLSFTVELDGDVVTTDRYLGAAGHLVAIRAGDLAYLHVHPHRNVTSGSDPGANPDVAFTSEFPTAGTYRLFLDFSHDGTVHTAAFTVDVPDAGADRSTTTH